MQLFKEVYHEDVFMQISQIYFVTQNVTTVNLAVTSDFNYDLIMFQEILINKFHLFHEYFLLIHYLNAVTGRNISRHSKNLIYS